MKVAILFSGGKDSCYSTWYSLHQGWEITSLITVISDNPDSFMFHTPNIKWTTLQAEAIGLPIHNIGTCGEKEEELSDLKYGLKELLDTISFKGVVSGVIQSEYQKKRVDKICDSLGIENISPLWQRDPMEILEEEISLGFDFILSSCSARGLTRDWIGRRVDKDSLKKLKKIFIRFGIHPAFEGGEAESFVLDAPIFRKKIKIIKARKQWFHERGILIIEKAVLCKKS